MSRRSANALAKQEKAALAAEPVDYTVDEHTWADHLTPQDQDFCLAWVQCMDVRKAALKAGYAPITATTLAYTWIRANQPTKPWLASACRFWREQLNAETLVDIRLMMERTAELAFSDVRDVLEYRSHRIEDADELEPDADGIIRVREIVTNTVTLKDSADLTDAAARSIKSVKQDANGNVQIEMHPKGPALTLLARMIGAVTDRTEVSGPGGGAIPVAAVSLSATVTPQEAALAWRAMIRGG